MVGSSGGDGGGGRGKGDDGCGLKIVGVVGEHGRRVVVVGDTVVTPEPHGGIVEGILVVVNGGIGGGGGGAG